MSAPAHHKQHRDASARGGNAPVSDHQPSDHAGRCIAYRIPTAGRACHRLLRSRRQGGSYTISRAARPFGLMAKTCTRGVLRLPAFAAPVGRFLPETGRRRVNASGPFREVNNRRSHVRCSVRQGTDDGMGGFACAQKAFARLQC